MPDLSIKDVPAFELDRLRARARRNQRSLQGELRVIISEAARRPAGGRAKSFEDVVAEIKKVRLRTLPESVGMIREDRDGR